MIANKIISFYTNKDLDADVQAVTLDTHCKIMGDIIHFTGCTYIARMIEKLMNNQKSAQTLYSLLRLLE